MTSIAEQVGRVVGGRYRLLAPVGAGASSQVYAASDTRLARRVAVKVLHPMLAADRAFLRRFRAEARLAASLDHPHIMRVFDWGEEAEGPYLVLEYLGGGSLRALLDTGAHLSHAQVASLGAQAAAGLAYAHRRGIVHRDIKPSNLLFDDEGHLRIADFGVARALAESALTEPLGAIFGTARYASPEQAEARSLDDRTDVYSLALVLYEALTGRVPFSGDTITAVLMARVGAVLPSAPELGPLAPILAQAAISEPLARLDAAALYSDLELLGRELPPAAPLPLARTSAAPGAVTWSERDPTVIDDIGLEKMAPEPPAAGQPVAGAGPEAGSAGGTESAGELQHEIELTLLELGADAVPRDGPPAGPELPASAGPAASAGLVASAGLSDGSGSIGGLAASPHPALETPNGGERSGQHPHDAPGQAQVQRRGRKRLRWVKWVVAVVILLGAAAGATVIGIHNSVYGHVVPTLKSLTLAKAEKAAARVGLVATETSTAYSATVPAGVVIAQSVPAGRHERAHSVIGLEVSKGVKPVPVPSLAGDGAVKAVRTLTAGHLGHKMAPTEYSATVPAGYVITWRPSGGTVAPNTVITITVSKGPPPRSVPSVPTTDTFTQAQQLLTSYGFKAVRALAYSRTVGAGFVISTSPNPSSGLQPYGTTVRITISRGPEYFQIPSLIEGESVAQATRLLEGMGFAVIAEGHGRVIDTFPTIGSLEPQGTTIYLFAV